MHEDGYWLQRIWQGDKTAFEQLYEKYSKPLFRVVLGITRDRAAAEEILQESFVRLYQHARKLDPERPVMPWLHRVAINLSYNWLVRDRMRFTSLDNLVEHWRIRLTNRVEVDREVEERERINIVREAIARLDFDQRVVIVLFYLQGLSLAEIAETLDVPIGTTKSRLHYARKALERMLLADAKFIGEVSYEPL